MPHTPKTTSPARRGKHTPHLPRMIHMAHHREPDGTIHTLCGLHLKTTKTTTTNPTTRRCPACEAANHLLELNP